MWAGATAEPEPDLPVKRVSVRGFQDDTTGHLLQARHGMSFLITADGKALAGLRPPSTAARLPRQPGALRGRVRMAPDFDVLPPAVLAAMEGQG